MACVSTRSKWRALRSARASTLKKYLTPPTLSEMPVFNIFEPLVQELATRAARRVAVFGTRFVMESALFGEVNEVEIVKSRPHEMDYIHNTYVELARTGEGSEEQHRNLTALAHTLLKRDGVDAIILAGT